MIDDDERRREIFTVLENTRRVMAASHPRFIAVHLMILAFEILDEKDHLDALGDALGVYFAGSSDSRA